MVAYGIMRGQFMFNKSKFYGLIVSALVINVASAQAVSVADASANAANLSLNVASQPTNTVATKGTNALVSPSQAKAAPVAPSSAPMQAPSNVQNPQAGVPAKGVAGNNSVQPQAQVPQLAAQPAQPSMQNSSQVAPMPQEDFNFDLKMKSLNAPAQQPANGQNKADNGSSSAINDVDLPKDIQYKANPVEALGNSILTQMDSDLFSQMSEIEKSTTLLTLELRREKIRNEIEAQKAIRQKSIDDQIRQKEEQKLQDLERKKKIEAQVLQEKQALLDKEKLFEVLKQRKLLNAYMNQMLVNQQEWLKEKENLYAQISALEGEKKELIELFKTRINKVLEASAKNIQVALHEPAEFTFHKPAYGRFPVQVTLQKGHLRGQKARGFRAMVNPVQDFILRQPALCHKPPANVRRQHTLQHICHQTPPQCGPTAFVAQHVAERRHLTHNAATIIKTASRACAQNAAHALTTPEQGACSP